MPAIGKPSRRLGRISASSAPTIRSGCGSLPAAPQVVHLRPVAERDSLHSGQGTTQGGEELGALDRHHAADEAEQGDTGFHTERLAGAHPIDLCERRRRHGRVDHLRGTRHAECRQFLATRFADAEHTVAALRKTSLDEPRRVRQQPTGIVEEHVTVKGVRDTGHALVPRRAAPEHSGLAGVGVHHVGTERSHQAPERPLCTEVAQRIQRATKRVDHAHSDRVGTARLDLGRAQQRNAARTEVEGRLVLLAASGDEQGAITGCLMCVPQRERLPHRAADVGARDDAQDPHARCTSSRARSHSSCATSNHSA